MHHLCTLFDSNYLPRGLALFNSLEDHTRDFTLWVLCLDKETEYSLKKINSRKVKCIPLNALEKSELNLLEAKNNRGVFEYYFTCKAYLMIHLLKTYEIEYLTYVDADIYFYSSFKNYENYIHNYSIALSPHRFPQKLERFNVYGKYNAGLISFRNDDEGLRCLDWWRGMCTDWCLDKLDNDRFADQKYLNKIPSIFNSVKILDYVGINAAPWNIVNCKVKCEAGKILLDDHLLLFYHFHGVSKIGNNYFNTGFSTYGKLSNEIKEILYMPYLKKILTMEEALSIDKEIIIGDRKSQKIINAHGEASNNQYICSYFSYLKYFKSLLNNAIIKIK